MSKVEMNTDNTTLM